MEARTLLLIIESHQLPYLEMPQFGELGESGSVWVKPQASVGVFLSSHGSRKYSVRNLHHAVSLLNANLNPSQICGPFSPYLTRGQFQLVFCMEYPSKHGLFCYSHFLICISRHDPPITPVILGLCPRLQDTRNKRACLQGVWASNNNNAQGLFSQDSRWRQYHNYVRRG